MATQTSTTQNAEQRSTLKSRQHVREMALGYLFLAPACLLLFAFELYPIAYGLYISSCDWRLRCTAFIGLDNYLRAVRDPAMWRALGITVTYALISIPVQLILGLVVAYLLFQKIRSKELLRVLYFLPYITATVAAAAVWSYLYSPDNGLFNQILRALHLPTQRWLGDSHGIFALMAGALGIALPAWAAGPSLALVSLIVFTTWVFVGFDITIFLAGLGAISTELYEAARLDGATERQLFRFITLPLLSPTTYFLLTFTIIGTFKAFNHIYVMTQGGPGDATTTASLFIFNQLYQYNRYGYSAALSFILFIVILLLTILQNRLTREQIVYD